MPTKIICTPAALLLATMSALSALGFGATCFCQDQLASRTPSSWLGFRGDGTASAASGPSKLDLGDNGNLAWQAAMPGRSVAGPIVVGDLVVATSSGGQDGEVLFVTGIDLASGDVRWEHSLRATGRPYCHPSSANAAPSPASDGQRVVAFFGSNDLACFSLSGDLLWHRGLGFDYPKAGNDVGMASSPAIADGAVIVQVEAQGDAFVAGIDLATGKNLWRITRPRRANWASPVVIRRPDDSLEVVLQSGDSLIGVDPRTGTSEWEIGEGRATIASATPVGDYLLVPGNDVMALDIGRSATAPEIVWRNNKLVPRSSSIAAEGDRVYALKGSVLVAATAQDGEVVWQQRLSGLGSCWATPVVADGKLYVFDQTGKGLIIEDQGDAAETLSEVQLREPVLATPAIAAGRLIVRSERNLFCFD